MDFVFAKKKLFAVRAHGSFVYNNFEYLFCLENRFEKWQIVMALRALEVQLDLTCIRSSDLT